jgi:hypothetical protein
VFKDVSSLLPNSFLDLVPPEKLAKTKNIEI